MHALTAWDIPTYLRVLHISTKEIRKNSDSFERLVHSWYVCEWMWEKWSRRKNHNMCSQYNIFNCSIYFTWWVWSKIVSLAVSRRHPVNKPSATGPSPRTQDGGRSLHQHALTNSTIWKQWDSSVGSTYILHMIAVQNGFFSESIEPPTKRKRYLPAISLFHVPKLHPEGWDMGWPNMWHVDRPVVPSSLRAPQLLQTWQCPGRDVNVWVFFFHSLWEPDDVGAWPRRKKGKNFNIFRTFRPFESFALHISSYLHISKPCLDAIASGRWPEVWHCRTQNITPQDGR